MNPATREAEQFTALYRELERFILTRAVDLIREAYMPQPNESFRGLVSGLRPAMAQAAASAVKLKKRFETSLAGLSEATSGLAGACDEMDAAAAEINGVLLGDTGNGGPPMDAVGNSPVGSAQAGAGTEFIKSVTAPFVTTITAPMPVR